MRGDPLVDRGVERPSALARVGDAAGEALEVRIQATHDVRLAADHEAVAALEPEHAAAGAAVHVVEPVAGEPARAIDVVAVVGVPAVDDGVTAREAGGNALERRIDDARRDHEPDDARLGELFDEGVQRRGAGRALAHESLYGGRRDVVHHAGVAPAEQATHHVRAHATQPDHADLHSCLLSFVPTARPWSTARVWRATIRSSFVSTTRTT